MIHNKGSILIIISWILIILTGLSIAVSFRSAGDIKITHYETTHIKATYLGKAAIMKMLLELSKDKNSYDSLNEAWHNPKEFKLGRGIVFYGASDEEAKLNLNGSGLKKEHLVSLGIDDAMSQKILDYRLKKGQKAFEFTEELFLIDGMTQEIYSQIEPYITIYRGNDSKVNINTASEKVLHAILEGNDTILDKIVGYRKGSDAKEASEDDGVFTDENLDAVFKEFGLSVDDIANYHSLFTARSDFFRIWAKVSFSEDKITVHISSVVDRNGKIYSWKEE